MRAFSSLPSDPQSSVLFGSSPAVPFSVLFEENQIVNRQFIELGGYFPSDMIVARNKYERMEKIMDHAFWLGVAVAIPMILGRFMARSMTKNLLKSFHLPAIVAQKAPKDWPLLKKIGLWVDNLGKHSPLQLPFEYLDNSGSCKKDPVLLEKISKNLALPNVQALEDLLKNSEFIKRVRRGKLWILMVDLGVMAFNGQFKLWAKNFLTEHLSGQKGYSGTFNYASKQYMEEKSEDYQKNKKKRMALSIGLALWSMIGLPLLVWGLLANKTKFGENLLGKLKNIVKPFNYNNAIFMSKWAFLWYSIHNYVITGALSARDKNERREHIVKALNIDFFFVVGDLLVSGIGAKIFNWLRKDKLGNIRLDQPGKMPLAKSLEQIFHEVGSNKEAYAYKLARTNYWLGLVATTLLMGITIPLWNNWYTKQKVLREQQEMALRNKKLLPLKPSILMQPAIRTMPPVMPMQPQQAIQSIPFQTQSVYSTVPVPIQTGLPYIPIFPKGQQAVP